MKKILIYLISSFLVLGGNSVAMAQTQQATSTQTTLPPAGLTPDSPFYFLNQFTENLQRFFTFNPEAKARLEIKFAAERISEIKVMIDSKGVQDKGVAVAEASLQDSLNRAAQIVASEKASGKDVNQLANSLDDQVGQNKELLKQTFEDQKDALDKRIEGLKAAISAARTAGDTAKVDALTKELQDLKTQKDLLDTEKHDQEDAIDNEGQKLEDQINSKDQAAKKIQEAIDGKAEITAQAQKEGIDIPAGTFNTFDGILAKAQSSFDAGNYDEARSFAKQAEKSLHDIERSFENLKEAKDNEDEINADQQGLEQEADQAQNENVKEEVKKAQEQLKEDRKNVQEDAKKALEQLREDQKKAQEGTKDTGD